LKLTVIEVAEHLMTIVDGVQMVASSFLALVASEASGLAALEASAPAVSE
jgi:hypothetical protein